MANNYCQSSSFIEIPSHLLKQAKSIVDSIEEELSADEEHGGFCATFEETGLWIREDESINPDHVEHLVKTLVDTLDLPGIHVVSWAYTCSKQRLDEFGGGAFAVQKGRDTIWIDAAAEVRRLAALPPNDKAQFRERKIKREGVK